MPLSKAAGYNLLELLIVLAVLAIVTTLAIPSFTQLQLQHQRSSSVQQLKNLLHYTRAKAATTSQVTTFCLSDDRIHCSRNAKSFFLIFTDSDNDNAVDSGELVYSEIPLVEDTLFRLTASNRPYIRYRPTGSVMDFGSIIICPANRNNHYASRMIVHRSGRARHGRDYDGDGIVEDSGGSPIDCTSL